MADDDRVNPFDLAAANFLADSMKGSAPQQQSESPTRARKKRKDALGQKADYHSSSGMLGVRLDNEAIEQVRALAERDGLSVNAWLKVLILKYLDEER